MGLIVRMTVPMKVERRYHHRHTPEKGTFLTKSGEDVFESICR